MDGQPGAGDLNHSPHNEVKGLISMTVCCTVTVCTEDYVPLLDLQRAGQTGSVPSVPLCTALKVYIYMYNSIYT